jgi:hypothetical protein
VLEPLLCNPETRKIPVHFYRRTVAVVLGWFVDVLDDLAAFLFKAKFLRSGIKLLEREFDQSA